MDRLQHDIQGGGLELFAHLIEVEADDTIINVKIGFVGKHIETALHEQLRRKGQLLRFTLRLSLYLVAPVRERRQPPFAAVFDEVVIDIGGAAVNDGFMERPKLSDAHLLLANAHHQFRLHGHWVFPGTVAAVDLQRIDMMGTGRGNFQHCALQRPRQFSVLPFRVDHNNVIVGGESDKGDGLFHAEGLAAAGNTQYEAMRVQQLLSVADQQISADRIDAIINTARILDLLNAERHQNSGGFSCQGAGRSDAAQAIGQGRVQSILLLIAENGELTRLLQPDCLQCLRVSVQLFQRVRHVYDGDIGKNHPLVTGTQIIQKFLCLRPQLFQFIRDAGGKIVPAVLPLLPPGNIRFDAENAALYLTDGLIRGDRQNVDGQHQVAREVRELGDHLILDVAGIVPQEQDAAHLTAHLKMVCLEAQSIRADIVPEIVSLPHGIAQVKVELFFLTGAEEIVKDTQTLLIIQRTRTALQPAEVLAKVGIDPMEEGAGLLDALPRNGHGDVLILDQVIALGCLVGHDSVVLSAVAIQIISTLPHQNTALKVRAI